MSANPALQTSTVTSPIDIEFTNKATHVYVKIDNPTGLSGRFEGPYEIVSRPSRSQVGVRVGSFASGAPRLQTYSWSSCKVAHLRQGQPEGSRPALGRKPNPKPPTSNVDTPTSVTNATDRVVNNSERGKIQMPSETVAANPIVTLESESGRPRRSTRNQNPRYIDAIMSHA